MDEKPFGNAINDIVQGQLEALAQKCPQLIEALARKPEANPPRPVQRGGDKLLDNAMNNVARGQLKALARKLDECPQLIQRSDNILHGTLLHRAVSSNRPEIIAFLLSRGADPNAIDLDVKQLTPLHYAALDRSREVIDLLLDAGADINRPDIHGDPPLHLLFHSHMENDSAREECHHLFCHMLERGAKIANSRRLMIFAAARNMTRVIERLAGGRRVEAPPQGEPEYRSPQDRMSAPSPLVSALRNGHPETVKMLLEYGAHWENNGDDGRDALMEAIERDDPDAAEMLLAAGVSSDARHYIEPARLPLPPLSSEELAAGLYEQNKNNVYFARGYHECQPSAEEFTAALMAELERFRPEARLLTRMTGFRFVGAVLEKFTQRLRANPERMENAMLRNLSEPINEDAEPEFAELAEMQDAYVRNIARLGKAGAALPGDLADALRETDMAMTRLDPRIPRLFNSGLERSEMEDLWKRKFRKPPPDDLVTLYSWRNGAIDGAEGLFQGFAFFPLRRALVQMDGMASLFPVHHFHIMENVFGCWLQFDTRPEWRGMACRVDREVPDAVDVYPNLAAFFGAFAECFRNGSFRIVSENGDDFLVGFDEEISMTFAQYQLRIDREKPPDASLGDDAEGGVSDADWKIPLA